MEGHFLNFQSHRRAAEFECRVRLTQIKFILIPLIFFFVSCGHLTRLSEGLKVNYQVPKWVVRIVCTKRWWRGIAGIRELERLSENIFILSFLCSLRRPVYRRRPLRQSKTCHLSGLKWWVQTRHPAQLSDIVNWFFFFFHCSIFAEDSIT